MGKKFSKFLNIITFGLLGRKAKKQAKKQNEKKNLTLTINTMSLPDVDDIVDSLNGIKNIKNVSATISTITFKLNDTMGVDFEQLKKISTKGVIKAETNITLLIGDCAQALKDKILQLKNE